MRELVGKPDVGGPISGRAATSMSTPPSGFALSVLAAGGDRAARASCGSPRKSDGHGRGEPETALLAALIHVADTHVADFDLLHRLTTDCVALFPADAAGLLVSDHHGTLRLVASSSEAARLVDLFQLQADEGPCLHDRLPTCGQRSRLLRRDRADQPAAGVAVPA